VNVIESSHTGGHQEDGDDTNPITPETLYEEIAESAEEEQANAIDSHGNANLQHIEMFCLYQPYRQHGDQHVDSSRQQKRCR
jgi:hypothetical protein